MENRMTLTEAFRALAEYGLAFWCGVVAGIATFVVEIILCKKGILFAGADRKLALAKQRGHMLTATRTSLRFRDREPEGTTTNRVYIANYEYTVNGKRRTKQVTSTSVKPPLTITLYYVSSPKRVLSEYDVGKNPLQQLWSRLCRSAGGLCAIHQTKRHVWLLGIHGQGCDAPQREGRACPPDLTYLERRGARLVVYRGQSCLPLQRVFLPDRLL